MGVQDDTEKVLRALHVMLAKGEQYPKEPSKVIVDKQQMLDLLSELNRCMYQMQEQYAKFGAENFGDASRAAVETMIADIKGALENR